MKNDKQDQITFLLEENGFSRILDIDGNYLSAMEKRIMNNGSLVRIIMDLAYGSNHRKITMNNAEAWMQIIIYPKKPKELSVFFTKIFNPLIENNIEIFNFLKCKFNENRAEIFYFIFNEDIFIYNIEQRKRSILIYDGKVKYFGGTEHNKLIKEVAIKYPVFFQYL